MDIRTEVTVARGGIENCPPLSQDFYEPEDGSNTSADSTR
jgi:hypothetical protein